MSWLTKWSFKNKAAITIMSILILALGVISYFTLPMEFLPTADQPQVSVVVMGQGTDADSMEKQVTSPIEEAVAGVKGKSNVYSTTGDGYSKIDILFESKTDMKEAKTNVQEALSSVQLPTNVSKPNVIQLNTSMIPIADISLTFKEGLTRDNLDLAEKKLIPKYKDVKGIASVQTYGTAASYVSITVDNKKLSKKNVTIDKVISVLEGKNTSLAVGEKVINNVTGKIDSLDKVKKLPVVPNVKLGDLAKVEVKKPEGVVTHINGKDALLLIVTKDSHSNAVSITKEVKKLSQQISKDYKNVDASVFFATGDSVQNSVHSMMKEVLLGAFFATVVIMLFLRSVRSTFITIVSIPLSLCFTLFLLSKSGVTLNILTLGGVAVAIGRLVDDSIVVIENIFRKMQKEEFSLGLIIDATKEVGSAITASTLTTVAVFLPIGLVNGGLQDFMLPFALTLTYSLLSSLIVALTVVPLMSAGLLKNERLRKHKQPVRFTKVITWSLNHKWVVLLLSLLLFVGSIGAYTLMPKGAVDNSSSDFVGTTLSYPNNTPIGTVEEKSLQLERYILAQKEVKDVYMQLGNTDEGAKWGDVGSPTEATYTILVKDSKNIDSLMNRIENQKKLYDGGDLSVSAASLMGASTTSITVDVIGNDMNKLEKTASSIKKEISDIKGIDKVSTNQDEKKTVYSLDVDPTKANTQQVAQQLGVMLNKTPVGTVDLEGKQANVFLESVLNPTSPQELKDISIMTETGASPVLKVASLKQDEKPTNQFHKNGDPYIQVTADVDPEKLSEINKDIQTTIFGDGKKKGLSISKDVDVVIGGASTQQGDDFSDLFITMLVSIGIVFLIMVITFKTIRTPFAILFSLPLAAIGAVLGLLISRITVDVTALLGALMLIGIVVTNAIVLLDRVKQNEKKMIMRDAIVEASATRMRPIVMTSAATICAMLPLLFKQSESGSLVSQSLAVVVIGGLAVATLLTLVVIPVVYELLHFRKSKKQRIQQKQQEDVTPL
ncbi:efflux RND transporter permease subunit [Priestia aryabhattai]|uniref:efflux RND transporter permease subunit n=1 Tax=Priestia aryabhattai TaxID=412384 RepID=UPI00203B6CBA|nr:efflux RND transporter permease subunit [Priestia aryabhattai]MCM3771748.1 efflux RND transporter permease subunit [Priestia aryabhattai]